MGTLIVALGLLLGTASAGEDDDARARELYQNGAVLYDEGRYEEAVLAFEEAYRLSARPALLFNIANALERAGHWQEALDVLARYRAYARADERETLDRRILSLERRIAENRANPPVAAPVKAESAPTPHPPPPPQTAAPTLFRPAPIALAGAGLVSLGVGAALGGGALATGEAAAARCATDNSGTLRCDAGAADLLAQESGSALAADVLVGAGILGLGAGVALALWGEGGPLVAGPGFVAVWGSF
jgi:tetratricopeptide (TPR) repeat protein